MSWDPTPLMTGVGSGLGVGILGYFTGLRQSRAQAVQIEVQAAKDAVATLRESLAEVRVEVGELRSEVRSLRVIEGAHGVLLQYVRDAWTYYEDGGTVPYMRPPHIVAMVRPELAKVLTGETPVIVIGEHIDDRPKEQE